MGDCGRQRPQDAVLLVTRLPRAPPPGVRRTEERCSSGRTDQQCPYTADPGDGGVCIRVGRSPSSSGGQPRTRRSQPHPRSSYLLDDAANLSRGMMKWITGPMSAAWRVVPTPRVEHEAEEQLRHSPSPHRPTLVHAPAPTQGPLSSKWPQRRESQAWWVGS